MASNANGNDNGVAQELTNYILHESSRSNDDGTSSSSVDIRRHALEQLVESTLGGDVTAAARRLVAANAADDGDDGWRNAADELIKSSSFRMLQGAVEVSSSRLPPPVTSIEEENDDEMATRTNDASSSKKVKIPEVSAAPAPPTSFSLFDMMDAQKGAAAAAAAPAPATSFSLFDMLDSQKGGGFSLPPRIMAYQVIERHEQEKNVAISDNGTESTTLELLEKADDLEDLSPDPESWEDIRQILYNGLLSPGSEEQAQLQSRYLKLHESFIEKCRGDNACSAQLWSLSQNLVGAVLALSETLTEEHLEDLTWDVVQSLLETLSHLAEDYVMSAVGNEREIERMLLGLCMILSNDFSACMLGMMEPMASQFEVWARFVDPQRFMTMIHASGLGGAALCRCESMGRNVASEIVFQQSVGNGKDDGTASLADIHHCNFLQSLSILRTILCRCDGSSEVVSLIHNQVISEASNGSIKLSSFLSPIRVAGPDDVQTLVKEVEENRKQQPNRSQWSMRNSMNSVLKPFRGVIRMKESNSGLVDSELEVMCIQTIQLFNKPDTTALLVT